MLVKLKTILIIEDEQTLLSALVDKFTREGFAVITRKNGKTGLKAALDRHPDLIILDLIMPIMDGNTMLANLKKDSWGKKSKVIILTNLSEEGKRKPLILGVQDYLVKSDIEISDVVKKVKKELGMKV